MIEKVTIAMNLRVKSWYYISDFELELVENVLDSDLKRTYQIETSFRGEKCLIFVEFKGKDTWEAAVFPATAQVNTGNQTLATVATEKPRFGEIIAIFAIGLWKKKSMLRWVLMAVFLVILIP